MSVRFTTWPIILATLMFFSSPGWAGSWQQSAAARVSTEYDTNPAMDPAYRGGIWRSIVEPSYTLKRTGDANELNAGLAAQIARSSNKMLSQDHDNPSVFLGWRRQKERGEFGLSARYDEVQTRISEIDNTGPNSADNTRATRAMSGNWSEALSERSTFALNGAYNAVSYKGGPLVDYVTRSGGLMFSYAWSERSRPFLKMSYADTEPAGSNTLSRFANALLGWGWEVEDYLEGSLQAGKSKTSGTGMAKQAAAEVKYKGQRAGLALNADRQVSPSGVGGFITVDQVKGSWSYALSERSNTGIDLEWRKNYFLTNIINRTSGAWLQHELNSRWGMRTYYLHKISERVGLGTATSDILGIALVYTHADF